MSALTTTAGPCAATASCTASGKGDVTYWAEKAYSEEDKTGTVVVVQVINTVLDTTSYSTIANKVPSNYVPPPTNAAGTKIASVTFSRHGTLSTTTIAYPTPFLIFPDVYTVVGTYQLDSSSGAKCISGANKTFDIATNPQPVWGFNQPTWNLSSHFDPNDPLGWGYSYGLRNETSYSEAVAIVELIGLLPDDNPNMPHSVVKTCKKGDLASPYVVQANPNWKVVAHTSVVYEGGDAKAAASSTASGGSRAKPSDGSHAPAGGDGEGSGGGEVPGGGSGGQKTGTGSAAAPSSPSGGSSQGTSAGKGFNSLGIIKLALPLWAAIWMGSVIAMSAGI